MLLIVMYRTLSVQKKILQEQLELLQQPTNFKLADKERLCEEWKSYVFVQALQVREAISKQVNNLHPKLIEDAPISHGLTNRELAEAFDSKQIEAITHFWNLFHQYIETHWKTEQGRIKTVFKGSINIDGSEVHRIHTVSNRLLPQLDQLLKRIKGDEH